MTFITEKADDEVLENAVMEIDFPAEQMLEVLEMIPGADLAMPVKEERETDWEHDGDHSKFMIYLPQKLSKIPHHSGETTVGCEKAIAYLRKLDKEISKAVQSDEDGVIDEHEAEKIRDQIMDYIDKLEDGHSSLMQKKTKKKHAAKISKTIVARINDGEDIQYFMSADRGDGEELLQVTLSEPNETQVLAFVSGEGQITKEAGTAKVVMFEDPFLHSITRILINSHVSAGRNIEEVYGTLKKKYAFTPREELSIHELLLQKGFPMNKDLGTLGDEVNPFDGSGVESNTNYYA